MKIIYFGNSKSEMEIFRSISKNFFSPDENFDCHQEKSYTGVQKRFESELMKPKLIICGEQIRFDTAISLTEWIREKYLYTVFPRVIKITQTRKPPKKVREKVEGIAFSKSHKDLRKRWSSVDYVQIIY
jgi:hypothetical protein